jgi:hypothetical protein
MMRRLFRLLACCARLHIICVILPIPCTRISPGFVGSGLQDRGVAHRLCRILFAMLRGRRDFSVSHTGVEQGDFKRTTSYSYRLRPKPAGCPPVNG